MDELASMLRVVEAWNHIRMELIFDSEIALEVLIKELEELLLERLRCPALCEGKVFIVRELAEVFAQNILEIIKHLI